MERINKRNWAATGSRVAGSSSSRVATTEEERLTKTDAAAGCIKQLAAAVPVSVGCNRIQE